MKSEFCPKDCVFLNDDDLDFVHNECHHSKDIKYDEPIPVEIIWYANVWINALIIGESEGWYFIQSPKSQGVISIKKGSHLIRK